MTSQSAAGATALAIIATAIAFQTVLLCAAVWVSIRMWKTARTEFEHRLDRLEGRVDGVADALRQMAASVQQSATHTSSLLRYGERFSGALAAVATTPKGWLLARAASKLMAAWRRRQARAA